jgi:hypothetical protein
MWIMSLKIFFHTENVHDGNKFKTHGSHGLFLTCRENKQSGMIMDYTDCRENK